MARGGCGMTALYVLLILITVFAALLSCPVTVSAEFSEKFSLHVGFLFFRYTVVPPKEKKKKAEVSKEEAPKKSRVRELYEAKGLSGFLKLLKEAANIASEAAQEVFRHTVFRRFWLKISACGEDAAAAALNYGHVCGAVGSGVGLLLGHSKVVDCRVDVLPDFSSQESSVYFSAKARVASYFLLKAALRALFRSMKLIKAEKTVHTT